VTGSWGQIAGVLAGQLGAGHLFGWLIVWALTGVEALVALVAVWRRPAAEITGGWAAKAAWLAAVLLLWWTVREVDVPVGALAALAVLRRKPGAGPNVPWADER
jgi:hypothetical protein